MNNVMMNLNQYVAHRRNDPLRTPINGYREDLHAYVKTRYPGSNHPMVTGIFDWDELWDAYWEEFVFDSDLLQKDAAARDQHESQQDVIAASYPI